MREQNGNSFWAGSFPYLLMGREWITTDWVWMEDDQGDDFQQ